MLRRPRRDEGAAAEPACSNNHGFVMQVVEVTAEAERPSRFGGRPQKVAECLVGDETACVVLTARNEQGN